MRFLEGEPLLYSGVLYIVKGYQHPPGYVVAYPRYCIECSPPSRYIVSKDRGRRIYWDCIKLEVPVIPVDKALPYKPLQTPPNYVREFIALISSVYGVPREYIVLTGSYAAGAGSPLSDIDLVIYGDRNSDKVYRALKDLFDERMLFSLNIIDLYREYRKHSDISFTEYLVLRRNTVLQGKYRGRRYSIRLVPYEHGYMYCVNRVKGRVVVEGRIRILRGLRPYTTPALYLVELYTSDGRELLVMETYRLRYTELEPGLTIYGRVCIEEYIGYKRVSIDHSYPVRITYTVD